MSIRSEIIGNATLYLADSRDVFPVLQGQQFSGLLTDSPYLQRRGIDRAAPISAKYQSTGHTWQMIAQNDSTA